jgi:response regulator NasT
MPNPIRTAVADDEAEMRSYLKETLELLGHTVPVVAATGPELVKGCRDHSGAIDLIVTDIKMPELDGLEASSLACQDHATPIILVSAYNDAELVQRALEERVMAYLIKPIKQADLETAIALALRRFREFEALQEQASTLQQALKDRKLIEQAKGILMQRAGLDEPDAFRRLQKLASEKNQKLVEIARVIVTAEEAFHVGTNR